MKNNIEEMVSKQDAEINAVVFANWLLDNTMRTPAPRRHWITQGTDCDYTLPDTNGQEKTISEFYELFKAEHKSII